MPLDPIITQSLISNPHNFVLANHPTSIEVLKSKNEAKDLIKNNAKAISGLTNRLYAQNTQSLLLVLQGMDTSGKDGTTAACFNRTPPLNLHMAAFKAPSKTEHAHDYLWRVHPHCPPKGHITIFNRSHYEDVLVVKVRKFTPATQIEQRYEQINNFERHLSENGTRIIKCMLNISYETQGERLRQRLEEPHKYWKFNPGDLEDRALWPQYMDAYETMIKRTSTVHAPWYVVPSDSRSQRGALVSTIVRSVLEDINPQYPELAYRPSDYQID